RPLGHDHLHADASVLKQTNYLRCLIRRDAAADSESDFHSRFPAYLMMNRRFQIEDFRLSRLGGTVRLHLRIVKINGFLGFSSQILVLSSQTERRRTFVPPI